MNTLIISDHFLEPPSELYALRTVTMMVHENLKMDILLNTTHEMKDIVYKFSKPMGLMDYIDYILDEREYEDGIRIDTLRILPKTIVVKYIRLENQLSLLGKIKSMAGI